MSSRNRTAATPAKPPGTKPSEAKHPGTKAGGAKAAPKKARVATAAKASSSAEPSSQDKAAFLKAMSKGIEPNTAAARTVARKSGKKAQAAPTPEEAPKVEVLRRIPAPEKVVDTPLSAEAIRLAGMIERLAEQGELETLQPHAQQALVAALCKLYAANSEAGNRYGVLGPRTAVSATEVMIMCGALLKAVDLQVFELGMWQSWSST